MSEEKNKDSFMQGTKQTKEEKKAAKEKAKAEKLAKLAKKQAAMSVAPKKSLKVQKKSGGYNSQKVEAKWTEFWLKNESYKVERTYDEKRPNFSMVIPPPNITGFLHIGHAMMVAIEDTIVRYKRQNNFNVLYLPGLDHAGIATQSVVMKKLAKENKDVSKITREYFLKEAHEWSDTYGGRIINQFNKLGTSLDFSKQMFTLDKRVNNSVTSAFIKLHEMGLIYRENKIVNWSGKMKTTLSDLEVNYKEVEGGTFLTIDGKEYQMAMMYYIKYYLVKEKEEVQAKIDQIKKEKKFNNLLELEEIIQKEVYSELPYVLVGTTRPETILGDTAICINPEDERFEDVEKIFKEKKVDDVENERNKVIDGKNNNTNNNAQLDDIMDINEELKKEKKNKYKTNKTAATNTEEIKNKTKFYAINPLTYAIIDVIYDAHADLTLGTGILKVTPAHDPIDFTLGQKHNLGVMKILDENNCITNEYYQNMKRLECREKIRKHPCIVKEEKKTQILPFCSRSNDLVEPMVKAQWWMKCDGMAQRAVDAVRNNEIEMHPEEAKSVWYRWLENIKDWCLSRQLWWGHRIPAYKYFIEEKDESGKISKKEMWVVAESEEKAREKITNKDNQIKNIVLEQDEDVLDTWFSSGLWPFSTMGWGFDKKDQTETYQKLFKNFFPNSMLETGSDILFFWVARMVMLSYTLLDVKPFDTILLHGIVRDAHGRKMSKSLGNVIDPIFVIDGITKEDLIKNISTNVSDKERKRAEESIKLDYPDGIPQCGADALRFTLLSYTNKMKDINLDILRVAGYSRLCNKIFNAFKFVTMKAERIDIGKILGTKFKKESLTEESKTILEQLNQTIREQHECMETYNFMNLTQSLHHFILHNFCDVYIESIKNTESDMDLIVLKYVFNGFLKMLNPTMPFIAHELFSKLNGEENKLIEDYPKEIEFE